MKYKYDFNDNDPWAWRITCLAHQFELGSDDLKKVERIIDRVQRRYPHATDDQSYTYAWRGFKDILMRALV